MLGAYLGRSWNADPRVCNFGHIPPWVSVSHAASIHAYGCDGVTADEGKSLHSRCGWRASAGDQPRGVSDEAVRVMLEYVKHLCAVPNCPCVTHRLGLRTLAELMEGGYFAATATNRPS